MIDQIGYTEANTFAEVFFAAIVFVVLFAVVFLGERYESKKEERALKFFPVITISFAASLGLGALGAIKHITHWGISNENLQTIKTLEIEASDLSVDLHSFIQEGIDRIRDASEDRGFGSFIFMTEKPLRALYKTDFLTMDEFIVAKQYLENCYPGEAGQAAREYLSLYPAEGRILTKKLVKAQSLTPENEIQKDCLNSVSLTFLE